MHYSITLSLSVSPPAIKFLGQKIGTPSVPMNNPSTKIVCDVKPTSTWWRAILPLGHRTHGQPLSSSYHFCGGAVLTLWLLCSLSLCVERMAGRSTVLSVPASNVAPVPVQKGALMELHFLMQGNLHLMHVILSS